MRNVLHLTESGACDFLADRLCFKRRDLFWRYYSEIDIDRPLDTKNWSMPKVEAKLLYACTRVVMPRVVLELGTHVGYSTEHVRRALTLNGQGVVVTLDYVQHEGKVPRLSKSSRVLPITCDGVDFSRTLCFPVDLLFADGDHREDSTREFLANCKPHLTTGALVIVHDVCYPGIGDGVSAAMEDALGDDFDRIVASDSPCGLGVWVAP